MRIGIMQTVRALWEIEPHERLKHYFWECFLLLSLIPSLKN